MRNNRIAIITARAGSKRIPQKNIKEFCGKPIISYAIQAALETNVFDEVMVSTDSEEIAHIAREYGTVVPFMRSSKNADVQDIDTLEDWKMAEMKYMLLKGKMENGIYKN